MNRVQGKVAVITGGASGEGGHYLGNPTIPDFRAISNN